MAVVVPLFNEHELLRKIAEGDQRAFGVLFEQRQQVIFNIAYKLTKSRSTAKEIVQDVFLKLWNKREELHALDNFSAYINRMARNQSIDVLRLQAREALRTIQLQEGHLENGDFQTEETLQFRETGKVLQMALESLSPQQRKVYDLCHEQGMKYEEAARELGLSRGTVHSHMKQALKNIRTYVKQLDAMLLLLVLLDK
ncbi:RNA polymerase sigma-70 factor [Chitinophagaceae bacterium 26-R-25]|nr:RNA polymerase sigma-70 factor [Chitinophagaceae bacterium 26-R-25]